MSRMSRRALAVTLVVVGGAAALRDDVGGSVGLVLLAGLVPLMLLSALVAPALVSRVGPAQLVVRASGGAAVALGLVCMAAYAAGRYDLPALVMGGAWVAAGWRAAGRRRYAAGVLGVVLLASADGATLVAPLLLPWAALLLGIAAASGADGPVAAEEPAAAG